MKKVLTDKTKMLMGIAVKGETINYNDFSTMFKNRSKEWWDAAAIIVDDEKRIDKIVWGLPVAIDIQSFAKAVEVEHQAYKDYVTARTETNKALYDLQSQYDAFNQSQKDAEQE